MVSSTGGCGCFLGAAGGCGCWGCGRGSLGLPRSRCRSAPPGVGLRFRRVLRKAVPKQQQPRPFVVSLSRRAAHASLLNLCAGAENSSSARSISSVLHAASNPFCSRRFSDLRDTEAKRTAQRSPNTPRVLRAESRAIFSCVKRLHTANKQGALCERCVTARDVDARYKQDGVKPWAAAKQSTASPTTTRARCTRTIRTAGDWCGCET